MNHNAASVNKQCPLKSVLGITAHLAGHIIVWHFLDIFM